MKDSDAQLIKRTLDGDDTAFTELVERYQKQVLALVWRKIGDFHFAEEITQDTFLRAHQQLRTLRKPQRFASWLYVIASNLCGTWLRNKNIRMQLQENIDNTVDEETTYSEYIVAENNRITAETQRNVVQKLLAKLQESERTVMTLHYLGEMSCTEIGAFLGVSANTVKSRLRRAQQRLQKDEVIIREAIDNFQISPNLTETIMQKISRIKPAAPASSKPLMPWAVAASTLAVVLFMLGFGNSKYLARFQKPYSLDATAEMTVKIIDAPIVANLESKPDIRTQVRGVNAQDKNNNVERQPNDASAAVEEEQTEETMKDYTQWALPEKAKARLGKGGINAMQFSPDGTQLAVGNDIGIWLYDVKTSKEIALFQGICESLAFSPNGRFLANGGFGKLWGEELQLWEITTRKKISFTDAHRPATALHFSEDGKTLVSVDSWGATISRLDIETGERDVTNLEGQPDSLGHIIEVYTFKHDRVAGGKRDGKIRLWDTTTGKKLTTLSGHAVENQDPLPDTPVLALAFSPDGTRLASGSKDTTVRLWDITTNDEPITLREHTGWVNVLAFSPDGKILASGSTDKTVQMWNTTTGELITTLTGHINGIAGLTFSPDGSTLASASTDGTIKFWDTETGSLLSTRITGHTQLVKAAVFVRDSSKLATTAFNGAITFWDLKTSEKTAVQMEGDRDILLGLAFSPDGTKLASVGTKGDVFFAAGFGQSPSTPMSDEVIRITDVRTGRELTKTNGHGPNLDFSPDGKTVAFDYGVNIYLWDTETGRTLDISVADPNDTSNTSLNDTSNALAFSPDGKKLVNGTWGGDVHLWNSETGDALTSFAKVEPLEGDHDHDPIRTLAFSSDGTMLAVGSNYIRILMLGSEKEIGFKQMRAQAEALMFSPDTTVLVIGHRKGGIELWDIATGDKLTTLNGHTGPVETLVFSPDGKTLVSTGQDGTILVWDWDEALKGSEQ